MKAKFQHEASDWRTLQPQWKENEPTALVLLHMWSSGQQPRPYLEPMRDAEFRISTLTRSPGVLKLHQRAILEQSSQISACITVTWRACWNRLWAPPQTFWFISLSEGLGFCIFIKFPDDAEASGPGPPFEELCSARSMTLLLLYEELGVIPLKSSAPAPGRKPWGQALWTFFFKCRFWLLMS